MKHFRKTEIPYLIVSLFSIVALAILLLTPITVFKPAPVKAATIPAYNYTKDFDVSDGSALANAVATDNSGNVYVAGQFNGTVNFDPEGSGDTQTAANGNYDAFLTKFSSSGSYDWTKTFDISVSGSSAYGEAVATDSAGNVYMTGNFEGTVTFGGDTLTDASGYGDAFLTKFSSSGSYDWTKSFNTSSGRAYGQGVAIDSEGDVYIDGYFDGTVAFGGSDTFTNAENDGDAFLSEFSTSGTYNWTKQVSDSATTNNSSAAAWGLATDSAGNVYLTGSYHGTVTFGGSDVLSSGSGSGYYNTFLSKYSPSGNYGWTQIFNNLTTGSVSGYSIAVSSQNIYITGYFSGTVDFGGSDTITDAGGDGDAFLSEFSTSGTYGWTKSFDTSSSGASVYGDGVAVDPQGSVYVTGYFYNTVTFGGSDTLNGAGNGNAYLTKFSSDGTYDWTQAFNTVSGYADANGVATDTLGNTYVTGQFEGTVTFGGSDTFTEDGGEGDYNAFLTSFTTYIPSSNPYSSVTSSATAPSAPNTGFGIVFHRTTLLLYCLVVTSLTMLAFAVRRSLGAKSDL